MTYKSHYFYRDVGSLCILFASCNKGNFRVKVSCMRLYLQILGERGDVIQLKMENETYTIRHDLWQRGTVLINIEGIKIPTMIELVHFG